MINQKQEAFLKVAEELMESYYNEVGSKKSETKADAVRYVKTLCERVGAKFER